MLWQHECGCRWQTPGCIRTLAWERTQQKWGDTAALNGVSLWVNGRSPYTRLAGMSPLCTETQITKDKP